MARMPAGVAWILVLHALVLAQLAHGNCPGAFYTGTNYTTTFQFNGGDQWTEGCDGSVVSGCTSACCVSTTVQNCIPCSCSNTLQETTAHGRFRRAACSAIVAPNGFCPAAQSAVDSFLTGTACQVDVSTQLSALGCSGTSPTTSPAVSPPGSPSPTPPSPSPAASPSPVAASPPASPPVSPSPSPSPAVSPASPSPSPSSPSPTASAPAPAAIKSSSAGVSGGAIAGIAVGAIFGVALLGVLIAFVVVRRRRQYPHSRSRGAGAAAISAPVLGKDPEVGGFTPLETAPSEGQQRPEYFVRSSDKLEDFFNSKTTSDFGDSAEGTVVPAGTRRPRSIKAPAGQKSYPVDTDTTIGLALVLATQSIDKPAVVHTIPEVGSEAGNSTGVSDPSSPVDPARDLPEDIKIDPQQLQIYRHPVSGVLVRLGAGAQGEVYKGLLNGVADVAVKVMSGDTPARQARFLREIAVTANLRNKNVVPFYGACVVDQAVALIMDYMPNGDLFSKIASDQTGEYRWYKRGYKIALGIAKGLVYLHSLNPPILHMDLKTPNILLDSHDEPKIADIGLGKRLEGMYTIASCAGSHHWASPEQARGESVDTSADVFSFGVILWELCTGLRPMRGKLRPIRVEGTALAPGDSPECPAEIANLIFRCMQEQPAQRPSARSVHDVLAAWAKKYEAQ